MISAILIGLIAHIILDVQWMFIKILSAVITHQGTVIAVVYNISPHILHRKGLFDI